MELYTLDNLLRRESVMDRFESLIWTERYKDFGDFQLTVASTLKTRSLFTAGTLLAVNTSFRVMIVEIVEDTTDADGKKVLNLKGRSLESILESRVALFQTLVNPWTLQGTPGNIARTLFNNVCIQGVLTGHDNIPFISEDNFFPTDTLLEHPNDIIHEQAPDTLYNAIKSLCDPYDLGFRLVRYFDESKLCFNIYAGNNRTSQQSVLEPLVFGPSIDNLEDISQLDSIEAYKNVAYVTNGSYFFYVYAEGVSEEISGLQRRALLVYDADLPNDETAMRARGKKELANHRAVSAFDGEINQRSNFQYGINYELGDVVEVRSELGVLTPRRVTEQIFVCDKEGERSYPTLSQYNVLTT